jgi:hypothetical protein
VTNKPAQPHQKRSIVGEESVKCFEFGIVTLFGSKSALTQTEHIKFQSLKPSQNQQKSPLTQTESFFALQGIASE